ncbi:nitrate- and nitrite sensing domain-containing protein [Idiomarina sp.]|uniref:methyl-accepting chemotaxis protein n=1 Tax=Idiomarina sp. TaxID=1874361 RepID=UPI00260E9F3C|nr:nitrate- and nitrite sensing domain-containing protein [Idiomarina sp.]
MNWLRNLSMRNKLLLLVLPTLLIMLVLAVNNLVSNYTRYQESHRIELLTELTVSSAPLITALQRERGLSALTLASGFRANNVRQLNAQRSDTDQAIANFVTSIEHIGDEITLRRDTLDRLDKLQNTNFNNWRQRIDNDQMSRSQMLSSYTQIISTMMGLIDDVVAASSQAQITRRLSVYSLMANATESAGQERAAVAAYIAGNQFDIDSLSNVQKYAGQQEALINNSFYSAPSDMKPLIDDVKESNELNDVESIRNQLSDKNVFSRVNGSDWFSTSSSYISAINQANKQILNSITSQSQDIANKTFTALVVMAVITIAVVSIIIVLTVLILRGINGQVSELLNGIDFVMKNKDLRRKVDSKTSDELGRIGKAFNDLLSKFSESLQKIDQMSVQLATATEETSSTAEQNAEQIEKQQKQIEQVATATEEMSATAAEISENIQSVADAADNSLESKEKGAAAVRESINSVRSLATAIGNVGQVINQLQERSVDINRVIDVINNVAEQTNLLALNAAIEAARAGEHGRGFAVVADEVRQLASQTHNSTNEIADMLSNFRSLSETAYNDINQSQSIAEATEEQAQELDRAFQVIAEDINSISEMSTQIATASEEQVAVAKDIAGNMESVNEVSLLTLTGSQEIKSVTQEQAKSARELQDLAMEFKTA